MSDGNLTCISVLCLGALSGKNKLRAKLYLTVTGRRGIVPMEKVSNPLHLQRRVETKNPAVKLGFLVYPVSFITN
jgi:hypothetical protein